MKMIRYFAPALLVAGALLLFHGCNEQTEPQTGTVSFGLNTLEETGLKSTEPAHHRVTQALVSIVDENGELVYDKEPVSFYTFGESFVTTSLKLEVGAYRLTEFLLTDSTGNVLWATPLEGSPLAYLVDDPLPMEFSISAESTTTLHPQVVRIGDHHPSDFGYVSFDVDFVRSVCIKVYFKSDCYTIMDGDTVMYNDSVMYDDMSIVPGPHPKLLVTSGEGEVLLQKALIPGMQRVHIPTGYDHYRFRVWDCNSICFNHVFTPEKLRSFRCTGNSPLRIICSQDEPDVVITPEEVKEPTIEQGVFGRITMEVEDTTATAEYRVKPVVRDLYLYHMADADSIDFFMQEPACLYSPLPFEPVAVVRSNTSGYYQLPLAEGHYLYMVKVANGFYIDQYISSRQPGKLKVHEGEITHLDILIVPCYWITGDMEN